MSEYSGESIVWYTQILDNFSLSKKKYYDHWVYKSCAIFEYSCENGSETLLKAKKILKDCIHIFSQLIVINSKLQQM